MITNATVTDKQINCIIMRTIINLSLFRLDLPPCLSFNNLVKILYTRASIGKSYTCSSIFTFFKTELIKMQWLLYIFRRVFGLWNTIVSVTYHFFSKILTKWMLSIEQLFYISFWFDFFFYLFRLRILKLLLYLVY